MSDEITPNDAELAYYQYTSTSAYIDRIYSLLALA